MQQTVSKHRSTKRINDEPPVHTDALVKAYEQVFAKGNPSICACCGRKVKGDPYVLDGFSENSICLFCLDIETHVVLTGAKSEEWIPFGDARFFNSKGEDVSVNMQQVLDEYSRPYYRKMFDVLEGKGSKVDLKTLSIPVDLNAEIEKEIRSLRAAIDLSLDLGYKEDFLALTDKYNALIKKIGEGEYEL